MADMITQKYIVDADDFSATGRASAAIKKILKQLGFSPDVIRRASVATYEGEVNMVIHAGGGEVTAEISEKMVKIVLADKGPGIPDINLAMKEGWSTASDSIRALGFGAGMGLPNIKKYSDDFTVDTEVGKGTTLTIIIYA